MARKGNRRLRRIRQSIAATVLGLTLLLAGGLWLDRARDTDLADASADVTAAFVHEVPEDTPPLELLDVAAAVGITARHGPGPRGRTLPEDTGSGLAWGDYDGDGDYDLYLPNFPGPLGSAPDPAGGNTLYRNDGDRFVDVTAQAGVGDLEGFGMGASFADFDGDGDVDLYVTNHGPNRLYRNLGDGTFREVAGELGAADDLWGIAAAWGDADRDGRLDLYVTNYVEFEIGALGSVAPPSDPNWEGVPFTLNPNAFDPQPNRLLMQTPDGRFVDEALELGASNPSGRSLAASFVDLDGDGWLDLYVANDVSANVLLRNLGSEMDEAFFEDVAPRTGTADPRGSMGLSVSDLDVGALPADGRPDIFVSHWVAQENALYQAVVERDRLEYRDRVRDLRLAEVSTDRVGWGTAFVDLDLDGRLDLAVANGSTLEEDPLHLQAQHMFLLWNDGSRFHDVTSAWRGADDRPLVARGLAVADADLDGDVEVALSVNRGAALLLENQGAPRNGWLAVRLVGAAPLVFGARVTVRTGTGVAHRWYGADVSYASNHAPELSFGLGAAADASVEVRLLDGSIRRLTSVPASKRLLVPA